MHTLFLPFYWCRLCAVPSEGRLTPTCFFIVNFDRKMCPWVAFQFVRVFHGWCRGSASTMATVEHLQQVFEGAVATMGHTMIQVLQQQQQRQQHRCSPSEKKQQNARGFENIEVCTVGEEHFAELGGQNSRVRNVQRCGGRDESGGSKRSRSPEDPRMLRSWKCTRRRARKPQSCTACMSSTLDEEPRRPERDESGRSWSVEQASRQSQRKSLGTDVQSATSTYVARRNPLDCAVGSNVEDRDDRNRKFHEDPPICDASLRCGRYI